MQCRCNQAHSDRLTITACNVGQAPPRLEVFGKQTLMIMAHRGRQGVEVAGHDAGEHGPHALDVRKLGLLRRQELRQETVQIITSASLGL